MADRVQLPPPDRMIRELQTPDPSLAFFTELVARDSLRFQSLSPIRRGTPYSACPGADPRTLDLFPSGLWFLKETVPIGANTVAGMAQSDWVKWYWGGDPDAEGQANSAVEYLGDAIANPAYIRTFTVRRDVYNASPTTALGTAYTALIAIKVTAGGTGYSKNDTVNIAGSHGAAAALVVDENGVITHVIITAEGSGYDSASLPAITITTTTGSGATFLAIVQSKTAVLTSQKKVELNESDPRSHHYVSVVKTFEELPGPLIPEAIWDENLGPVQLTRQAVVWASQTPTNTATTKTVYKAREDSSYVAWKIISTWSDGTGSAGNPAYPIGKTDFNDPERGPIHQVSQITTDTTSVGSSTHSGGTVTTIRYEPYQDNPSLRRKITETWSVPRTRTSKKTNAKKQVVTVAETREDAANTPATPTATKDVDFKVVGDGTAIETTEEVPAVFDGDTRSIEIPDVTPAWAGALLAKTSTSSEAAATSVSDPTLSTGQISKRVRRTTEKTVQTDITARDTASLPKTRTNKKLTTEFGGAVIDDVQTQAVGSQSPSSGGLMVVDSDVEILGDGTSVKSVKTAEDGSWPVLSGTKVDDRTGLVIPYTKQIVAAGAAGGVVGSVYTEVDPLDKWRSVTIASTIPGDLTSLNRTYPAIVNHAFPDTLLSATLDWVWAEVTAAADGDRYDFDIDMGMAFEILQGYSGPCDGEIDELYTVGIPGSLPTVTKFFPQGGMKRTFAWYFSGIQGNTASTQAHARSWHFNVPVSLHDTIDITPSNAPSGDQTVDGDTIPATSPTVLPYGDQIVIGAQPELWRFGIFVTKIIKVTVPTP